MDAPPVQYVTTSDGYSIAYAVSGQGRPIIWMPHLFSHIQVYWRENSFIRQWLEMLAARFQLIQYDGRGQGMFSRGLVPEMNLADHVRDLEAVVNRLRLESFILLAVGWSGHVALHYATVNPGRVEALVLQGCPVHGADYEMTVFDELASRDWEGFLRMIAALGQPEDVSGSIARLRQTVNQADHVALARAWNASDVSGLLANVSVPTLILHPRDYFSLPLDAATRLAAGIPNSRVVVTDGRTAPGDAAQSAQAIEDFLTEVAGQPSRATLSPLLSQREVEVLRLLAAGRSNQQIADELVISLNPVRRHVSNVFDKIGAANRAEAATYATRNGLA
jgi:pimeloyl-ACP methyl ester carboxylesterase/DNA-binding CsgD family transcriptional regulator